MNDRVRLLGHGAVTNDGAFYNHQVRPVSPVFLDVPIVDHTLGRECGYERKFGANRLSKWGPLRLPIFTKLITTFSQLSRGEALENLFFVHGMTYGLDNRMTGGELDCELSARCQIRSEWSLV